jgi:DNA-binding MarR family transcriptional regulator
MTLEEAIKSSKFKDQRHKALIHIMYAAYQVKTNINQLLKNYALTGEQYNVLRILKGSHPTPLCVKDIASRLIERNSNVPRIADRLEIKKLVKRFPSPEDRRETLIQITPAGLNLLDAATQAMEAEHQHIANLTEAEAAQLNQLLAQMLQD